MEQKKILLLTLGTGPLVESGEAGYRETQYTIEGIPYKKNGLEVKTNFVAEPIIDYFVPDEIFILGTVKSVWHQFYASTITQDNNDNSYMRNNDYIRLMDIERRNGINTETTVLETLGKEISEIFGKIDSWEKYSPQYKYKKPGIHILLTKYGINEEELKENYRILKGIESYLQKNVEYEVAFDITHSFRSLPIYNLIIFNYIKNITKYNITISHVYYGNIDASHELQKKAPIVDLVDLVNVLNLTNGVAEFKDTGNAVSLIEMLDGDDQVKTVLERFDLATQLNAFDKIKEELKKLCELVRIESNDERYTGIREMIGIVLGERFLDFDGEEEGINRLINVSDIDLKFLLTRWFFNQNRMGLGLATGLEALRDINTPAFMAARNYSPEDGRKHRENAEAYFITIAQRIKNSSALQSELEAVVCNLGVNLRRYKEIRNVFAHSLRDPIGTEIESIREDIDTFKKDLFKLKDIYDKNEREFINLFQPVGTSSTSTVTSRECRLILDCLGDCRFDTYLNSRSDRSRSYDVLYLESSVRGKIFGGINNRKYSVTEKAFFLYKYLKSNLPDIYERIQIILYGCSDTDKEAVFRIFLERICNEDNRVTLHHVLNRELSACKKMRISVSIEEHQKQFENNELDYASVMEIPLVKYSSRYAR